MRDYLVVLEPLLRGENVAHGTVSLPDARPPSVLVAALGPAMLSLAGELADGTSQTASA
jgi:alkanesulfonate monooxygenase SsuD/methylene tetrahydromethanopterin reductase-like flavin-dependent oxidoreductase (luciferase family)